MTRRWRRLHIFSVGVASSCVMLGTWACIGEDPSLMPLVADGGPTDIGPTDDAKVTQTSDSDAGPPSCLRSPFGGAARIVAWSTPGRDLSVALTADERTVYVSSTTEVPPYAEIYTSTKPSDGGAFPSLEHFLPTAGPNNDYGLAPAPNNLELFFGSARPPATTGGDIYRVARSSTAVPYPLDAATPVPALISDQDEALPFVSGSEIWFSRGKDALYALVRAERLDDGGFGEPAIVQALNEPGARTQGVALEGTGLTIFFGSTRSGSKGGSDIWMARRDALSAPFGVPTPIAELNTASDERPSWISPDGCRLYFLSDRDNAGNTDVFVAERSPR